MSSTPLRGSGPEPGTEPAVGNVGEPDTAPPRPTRTLREIFLDVDEKMSNVITRATPSAVATKRRGRRRVVDSVVDDGLITDGAVDGELTEDT